MKRAELELMRATNVLAASAVDVRSEARAAHTAYRGTFELARHWRDAIVPLRESIEAESLLQYNGMITSTFDLLADTRERIEASRRALEARRDFFLAEVDIAAAIWGGGMGEAEEAVAEIEVAQSEGED